MLQLFGHQHRPKTWHVLITDEIAVDGPTVTYAKVLSKRYPNSAGWGDPRGHMPNRHASQGPRSSTGAKELLEHGHYLLPAGGRKNGKAINLAVLDRVNVQHRLQIEGRFLVHARCVGVLEAMRGQQADATGKPKKVSGPDSKSDKMSGFADAAGYGITPVFRHEFLRRDDAL